MLEFIIILLAIAVVVWVRYNVSTKGKAELKSIETCIIQIEKNPSFPEIYDKFIETWRSSTWIPHEDIFNSGYYDRILKICEQNSSNIKAWQLLEQVLQRLNMSFGINIAGKRNRANTFRLLADNLMKEFQNQAIKERIISLIHLSIGITHAEAQELYNTSLKILEANPNNQETKMLVLDLGRLYYSILRPNKKPTIYDEQAIQNDILVRSK
ncbi:MAG: hypothetical protein HCA25_22040 [Dolichospermum sp. DET50]|nr:hypothetical protein [Dolichospermum sp. DET66]MBS3034854.1 hypothetical protein [Dolichospermum sp. DET67]MBS3040057.1 hypothetical protein [Dolichospermum sp. DET50]QSX67235.1 MAG: hypothetical protein EZY12_21300 [Dolichospermum sp. DET69]